MTSSNQRPPKPTRYKHGDVHRQTGRIFVGYGFDNGKWREILYAAKTKEGAQLELMYKNSLQRARIENLPFDIDIKHLEQIKTTHCPIFGIPLSWGVLGSGGNDNSPSLDKIKPEYGYIKGNVCIISLLANKIKQDVGYEELYKVADWLHDKMKEVEQNVKPEQLASVPKKSRKAKRDDRQLSFIFTPWFGEDSNDIDNHSGTLFGDDFDSGAETSSGNSVGYGG